MLRSSPSPASIPDDFLLDRDARLLVRRGYAELIDGLGPFGGLTGGAEGVAGGREVHPVLTLENGERVMVRRYLRGGLMRHLNRDRYFVGHRAFAEVRATESAARAGVQVPRILAAMEEPATIGYRARLVVGWIEGAVTLSGWLPHAEGDSRFLTLRRMGEQVGMMHAAGISHADLNLRNVLVADSGVDEVPAVYLIDFDRARSLDRPVPETRRRAELERFARSARKLRVDLRPDDWDAIRRGYGSGWPLSSAR